MKNDNRIMIIELQSKRNKKQTTMKRNKKNNNVFKESKNSLEFQLF